MLQKLEGDIRQHIRLEQQMRLHIENLQQKTEDQDKELASIGSEHEDHLLEVRREKRRLDDLLTIRETQSLKHEQEVQIHLQRIHQLEVQVADWEKRYKH